MRLMSEQIKARLEAVGVSEHSVHWPVPPCSCSIRSQLRSILFYLACTHMHSYMYTCACVHLLIILFDVYIYIHRDNHRSTCTNAL